MHSVEQTKLRRLKRTKAGLNNAGTGNPKPPSFTISILTKPGDDNESSGQASQRFVGDLSR